jgi:hypothetical protein
MMLLENSSIIAQTPFGFNRDSSVPVYELNGQIPLPKAWVGGLNAPQFNECDLDGDGRLDIVVFDRSGDKILCFTRNADGQTFQFAPQFESIFPAIRDWMILRDYNQDGKPDIFCSAGNGISIYKNTSVSNATSSFQLITELLYSDYGNSSINLFVSRIDIPAIDDVDNDGDLDIITFYILGTCLEYHRNLSQELYGNSDSLQFEIASNNWGKITENAFDNTVNLNDSCGRNSGERHSGSTILLDDIDQDGDKDLLLGDVSYPEILCLINEPVAGTDIIIPTPTTYPAAFSNYSIPIFPGAFRIHANNDIYPDLIIAPNSESQSLDKNRNVLMYASNAGNFHFTQNEVPFLSNEILDLGKGAFPCFIDNDNDGDLDLIVGNSGEFEPNANPILEGNNRASIQLFENSGSNANPVYRLTNTDIGQLRQYNLKHLAPSSIDLNGDGRKDLVVGNLNGSLSALIKNPTGNDYTINPNLLSSIVTEQFACLTSGDVNNDGLIDLIIGGKSGRLQCFLNNGNSITANFSSSPSFINFGNAETIKEGFSNFGYSSPYFFNNSNGNFIFSGSQTGEVYLWKIETENLAAPFLVIDSNLANIREGILTSCAVFDLNQDGFPEMVVGNRRGGLSFFKGENPNTISDLENHPIELGIYPNPTNDFIQLKSNELRFPVKMNIYDTSGRFIEQIKIESSMQLINCSFLNKGIYLINIQKESQSVGWTKLVKM